MEQHAPAANGEQATLWNGPAGRAWVEMQTLLDQMFEPIERLMADASAAARAREVLDVGCGTGGTTLALARRLGADSRCVGIDISGTMIDLARRRAAQEGSTATFIAADAQAHPFGPHGFDMIVSRFGSMFFDDAVQAFSNLRRAANGGARLWLMAWRDAAQTPFMTLAERTAAPLLPALPVRRLDGPGQFAFADPKRVAELLRGGGWAGVEIQPMDIACAFPESELERYLTWLGPVGVALQQSDEATRTKVIDALRTAFQPFVHDGEVRFTAACWQIEARAPAT